MCLYLCHTAPDVVSQPQHARALRGVVRRAGQRPVERVRVSVQPVPQMIVAPPRRLLADGRWQVLGRASRPYTTLRLAALLLVVLRQRARVARLDVLALRLVDVLPPSKHGTSPCEQQLARGQDWQRVIRGLEANVHVLATNERVAEPIDKIK